MRNFLSNTLKDNMYLEKAVLTGILRVARKSIFSGLNNIEEKKYEKELLDRGITDVKKLVIVFKGKEVFVNDVSK